MINYVVLNNDHRVHEKPRFAMNAILALIFAAICSLAPRLAIADNAIVLPDIGDPSGAFITPRQEQELGAAFFRNLHAQIRVNQDLEIQDFIETMGERLAVNCDNPSQPFHFFVVLDSAINAFAGPGGYIGINSGLILASQSESELASVMAHEIAHVTQRHLYRAFEAARKLTIPSAAAMLAAILIGTQSAELGQAALVAAQAGATQYQIDFTRDNEQEADRVGMRNLAKSDFDPRGMPAFFERLERSSRYYGDGPPEFLRTHPVTASRISDTRGRAEKFPYRQFLDSTEYLLTRAKLRVLTARQPDQPIAYFKSRLDRGTEVQKSVARYGHALALAATGKAAEARPLLESLVNSDPEQKVYVTALAGVEMELGNSQSALNLYAKATERFPDNRAITLGYASALMHSENFAVARKLISDYLVDHQATPEVYRQLSRAYGNLGQAAQSHRYLAEAYYLAGQTEPAIKQIKIALNRASGNHYLTVLLEERLKEYNAEEQAKQQEKE